MSRGGFVIQGYFPGGVAHIAAAAKAENGPTRTTPEWVQQRIGSPGRASVTQRKAAPPASPAQANVLPLPSRLANFPTTGGQPLEAAVRQRMESCFGTSFADVRVHVGPYVSAMGALAFTQGSHIHFAPQQYSAATPHGRRLLGHELTHVVQQRARRAVNPFGTGVALVHNGALEAEAERMALRAAAAPAPAQPVQRLAHPQRVVQPVLKPTITVNQFFKHHKDWDNEKARSSMAKVIEEAEASPVTFKPDDLSDMMRALDNRSAKNIAAAWARMKSEAERDYEQERSGTRGHMLSRHISITDAGLEARLRDEKIAAATRVETKDGSGSRIAKICNAVAAELPASLRKWLKARAGEVLAVMTEAGFGYSTLTTNPRRLALLGEVMGPQVMDVNSTLFTARVTLEIKMNGLAVQLTGRYVVTTTEEFTKTTRTRTGPPTTTSAPLTMHSGSNSPAVDVLANDTPATINAKISSLTITELPVTAF